MPLTFTALFDGSHLTPVGPLELEPERTCRVTVETEPGPVAAWDLWSELDPLRGTLEAPADWAREHDHYLYGSRRRSEGASRPNRMAGERPCLDTVYFQALLNR